MNAIQTEILYAQRRLAATRAMAEAAAGPCARAAHETLARLYAARLDVLAAAVPFEAVAPAVAIARRVFRAERAMVAPRPRLTLKIAS